MRRLILLLGPVLVAAIAAVVALSAYAQPGPGHPSNSTRGAGSAQHASPPALPPVPACETPAQKPDLVCVRSGPEGAPPPPTTRP